MGGRKGKLREGGRVGEKVSSMKGETGEEVLDSEE